ncbi:hypothetical protein [Gallintestinimicrobium sp.]|uniref:hypothetical protein n=1 Tax=Gallintestinimicrobium sp. TaxID=2981655 RepID=UPI00399A159C
MAALRIEEGHWEGDTVVGKKAGKQAVVLSLLEKKTENYIALHIPAKDADSVLSVMQLLKEEFGNKFSQVFKTITVDNGPEFSGFAQVENWGSQVYFRPSLHILGAPLKTSATTGCSGPSCPRVSIDPFLQSTSYLPLMS